MKKRELEFLAEEMNIAHIAVFFISATAMLLIFFYEPLKIYSAIWLASLWLIDLAYGFKCPLTIKEYNLRIKAGEHVKRKKFIPQFFERYFNLNIPDWLAEVWLGIYFFISVFVIINHFFF